MNKSKIFNDLPPFIYGTTRLGDSTILLEDRINLALSAMESVSYFHTSEM